MALVNGFDAWVETPRGTFAISSQRYAPEVVHPDGVARLESFTHEPWPRWTWRLTDDLADRAGDLRGAWKIGGVRGVEARRRTARLGDA